MADMLYPACGVHHEGRQQLEDFRSSMYVPLNVLTRTSPLSLYILFYPSHVTASCNHQCSCTHTGNE